MKSKLCKVANCKLTTSSIMRANGASAMRSQFLWEGFCATGLIRCGSCVELAPFRRSIDDPCKSEEPCKKEAAVQYVQLPGFGPSATVAAHCQSTGFLCTCPKNEECAIWLSEDGKRCGGRCRLRYPGKQLEAGREWAR